jgi:hypothetical protein
LNSAFLGYISAVPINEVAKAGRKKYRKEYHNFENGIIIDIVQTLAPESVQRIAQTIVKL